MRAQGVLFLLSLLPGFGLAGATEILVDKFLQNELAPIHQVQLADAFAQCAAVMRVSAAVLSETEYEYKNHTNLVTAQEADVAGVFLTITAGYNSDLYNHRYDKHYAELFTLSQPKSYDKEALSRAISRGMRKCKGVAKIRKPLAEELESEAFRGHK